MYPGSSREVSNICEFDITLSVHAVVGEKVCDMMGIEDENEDDDIGGLKVEDEESKDGGEDEDDAADIDGDRVGIS